MKGTAVGKYLNRLRFKRNVKHNPVASSANVNTTARSAVDVMAADLMERLIEAMDEVNA